MEDGFTDYFSVETGLHQGCILLPFLFIMVLDLITKNSTNEKELGINLKMDSLLSDLDFADGIALLEEAPRKQQELTASLENNASKVGLTISVEKTKTMNFGCDANTDNIIVHQKPVENVERFQYHGSIITNDDVEIDNRKRIGQATTVFNRMDKIWKSNKILLKIKL